MDENTNTRNARVKKIERNREGNWMRVNENKRKRVIRKRKQKMKGK